MILSVLPCAFRPYRGDDLRGGMIKLLCIAGLSRGPQIIFRAYGAAISLSLIGERGSDEQFIVMATMFASSLEIA
ncbi:MAG TPA: hypothetical protein VF463_14630 [Sphingobium sp.]